jgi:hypothetical protein
MSVMAPINDNLTKKERKLTKPTGLYSAALSD